MLQKIKNRLKNQKGFTLIELLAVIVILAIIAAIAIPSISGIINNSKKDAHISNAEMMVSAARTSVAANDPAWGTGDELTLRQLIDAGYLEELKSPGKTEYNYTLSKVTRDGSSTSGTYTYEVLLVGGGNSGTVEANLVLQGNPADIDRNTGVSIQ
jgi:type IV pilus assembly protein PilA